MSLDVLRKTLDARDGETVYEAAERVARELDEAWAAYGRANDEAREFEAILFRWVVAESAKRAAKTTKKESKMKIRIVAKSLAVAPLHFAFHILVPSGKANARLGKDPMMWGHEIATTIEDDKLTAPGATLELSFEWPLEDFKPRECRFKATVEASLQFQLLVFEADGLPLIQGSGEPCGPGERVFA